MMGAAVATVIGQVVTAVLAIWYIKNMELVKPAGADFRMDGSICRRTLILGLTSFLSQISLVASMAAINNMIRKYGALDPVFGQEQYAQIPMAVVGIVMKFFQIVISIVVGMAAGCIPIVGFNMGAGRNDRVKELFTKLLTAEAAVGAIALVIVQAMGKAAESTALSMIREIVFGVGFALLLPRFFGLDGVLYSMPLSDILTFIIAVYLIIKTYGELSKEGSGEWKTGSSRSAANSAAADAR